MAKPTQRLTTSFRDYDKEVASVQLWLASLTAANFDAQATLRGSLITGLRAISIGEYSANTVGILTVASAAAASSVQAQRETKWLLRYTDANGYKYTAEVLCADLTKLATNSEFMADTPLTSFATPFEAAVVSPYDGSAVTLISAQAVGRRT